jgi:formylglycine-generating enzyme required for sulfatase activity
MRRWAESARDVLSRRDWHKETLSRLRGRGKRLPADPGPSPGGAAKESDRPAPERWRFDDTPTQWQHDLLQQLVVELDWLLVPEDRLARVLAWLRRTPSSPEFDARWREAAASIESEHPGAHLARQEGLFPIGRDGASGLWEFVDLNTGVAPARDASGRPTHGVEDGVVFVFLPGGRFLMGSPEGEAGRKPKGEALHDVELAPFLIAKYEINQSQWTRIVAANPSRVLGPDLPVDSLSWLAAREFCRKAGHDLPSEAQWEFACRGGMTGPYGFDGPLDEAGWYLENSGNTTRPVGRKLPNRFGLFDMHGNVIEWCRDVYDPDYYRKPEASGRDPVNEPPGSPGDARTDRVLRGGPFSGKAEYCRCADRYWQPEDAHFREHGIRPVWPIR